MAFRDVNREEIISTTEIQPNDLFCPRCKKRNYVTYGTLQRKHIEVTADGKLQHWKTDEEGPLIHEIDVIHCLECRIRFVLKPAENYNLEQQIQDLRKRYIAATGIDPYGADQSC